MTKLLPKAVYNLKQPILLKLGTRIGNWKYIHLINQKKNIDECQFSCALFWHFLILKSTFDCKISDFQFYWRILSAFGTFYPPFGLSCTQLLTVRARSAYLPNLSIFSLLVTASTAAMAWGDPSFSLVRPGAAEVWWL